MTTQIFFNETTLNGKFEVRTSLNLNEKGIKKYSSFSIFEHKGEIVKGVNAYWVSKSALENIKTNYKTERASF